MARGSDDDLLKLALEVAARERGDTTADVDSLEPRHLEQARLLYEASEARHRKRFQRWLGVVAVAGAILGCLFLYELGTPVPVVTRAGFTTAADPAGARLATTFTRAQAAGGLTVVVEIEDLLADASFVLDTTWRGPDGAELGLCSQSRQHGRERRILLACRPTLPQPLPLGAWHVQVLLSHPRLYQLEVPIPGSGTPGQIPLTITP